MKSDSLSGTKPTKRSLVRADAADGAADDMATLDPASRTVVPVASDGFDDDILGEVVGPATPAAAFESAPDEPDSDDPPDDILGLLSETPDAPDDDLDDMFEDLASPSAPESGPAVERSADPVEAPVPPDRSETEPPAALPAAGPVLAACGEPESGRSALASKRRKRAGGPLRLAGTREISRKAYVGGIGMIGLLTMVSVGQAAIILANPAPAAGRPHRDPGHDVVAAALPINYATVDLDRFIDKTRSLPEGGRQILGNPAVKEAIVELDGGEQLYQQLRALAGQSAAADLVSIRNNRVRVSSCDEAPCGDKTFRLTYDMERKRAVVCTTEKYLNGAYVSYRYSPGSSGEVPHCG